MVIVGSLKGKRRRGPRTVRFGHDTLREYLRVDFIDAWGRFLPSHPSQSALVTDVTAERAWEGMR